jgi:hypothetical protein
VARQPNEKKMAEMAQRIVRGGLTRDAARQERREEKQSGPRPQPFVYHFKAPDESFQLRIQFRKSHVSVEELQRALLAVLQDLEERAARGISAA